MTELTPNLLKAKPIVSKIKKRQVIGRRTTFIGLLLFLSLIAGVGVFGWNFYIAARGLINHTQTGLSYLKSAENAGHNKNFIVMVESLELADKEFAAAQFDLLRLKPLNLVPQLHSKLEAAEILFKGGRMTIASLEPAVPLLTSPLLDRGFGVLLTEEESRLQVLKLLNDYSKEADVALDKLDQAINLLESVKAEELGSVAVDYLPRSISQLKSVREPMKILSFASRILPPLSGYPEARNYLIFLQNNTELRPTGGFLGVYGLAKVEGGRLVDLVTDDIYALDGPSESVERPAPPEPIGRYINIKNWYLRDANWSPDWPTSVKVMEQFFHEEASLIGRDVQPIDGVIGLTPELVSDLLRITGPILVDGKTFNADNLVDQLEFEVEQNYITEGLNSDDRKDIINDLANELILKLTNLQDISEPNDIPRAVLNNLEESHLLFWFREPELQEFVLAYDAGGKMAEVKGDYLSVIDANLASFKSDRVVYRTINYSIHPEGERHRASVTITYDHQGRGFDWKTTRYRTYVRVYVPNGSEFLEVKGAMVDDKIKDPARRPGKADVFSELDRTVFGAFVSTEPGERRTITFNYLLPREVSAQIAADQYFLLVEKQPGTIAHGLTLDLNFDNNLTSANPAEDQSQFGDSRYSYTTDLLLDRSFTIGLARP